MGMLGLFRDDPPRDSVVDFGALQRQLQDAEARLAKLEGEKVDETELKKDVNGPNQDIWIRNKEGGFERPVKFVSAHELTLVMIRRDLARRGRTMHAWKYAPNHKIGVESFTEDDIPSHPQEPTEEDRALWNELFEIVHRIPPHQLVEAWQLAWGILESHLPPPAQGET